jgi:transcription elongation factor GreA
MDKVPMTTYGYSKLSAELKNLETVERPNIIEAIEEARAHGDLSENAEYHAAKEQQGFIESRIAELKGKLGHAQVIDPMQISGVKAVMGATITVVDVDTDKEFTYVLVGPDEANIDLGLISVTSPIGRAFLGKVEEDEATVQAPNGERVYEVLNVEFKEINPDA